MRSTLRKLAASALAFSVIATTPFGVFAAPQSPFTGPTIQQAGSVVLSQSDLEEISDFCTYLPTIFFFDYEFCVTIYKLMKINSQQAARVSPKWSPVSSPKALRLVTRIAAHAQGESNPAFSPSLSSSTPGLPFLGNPLAVLSFVPNATTAADATVAYATALRRQSDCSLDEDYILPSQATPDASYLTSLTGAQDYFHQLSGLTTTPDVFANGCSPQTLGLPASNFGGELLGQTSDGAAISAQLATAGLYVTITDLTANTVTNTQVTSGSDPGAFYAASLRRNGIMDLVETGLTDPATSAPATAVLLGNGDGTFQKPVYYDVSANTSLLAGFTVDDVNGDGIPDIVVLNGTVGVYNGSVIPVTGTVTTLIGKGDGTFTIGPVSNLTWTDSLQAVSGVFKSGDVKDLLVGGTVLFGAGDGSFTQGPTNDAIANLSINTPSVGGNAVGSLRNNGKLDVVVSEPGYVSIFYGNGDGTFQAGPSYAALPDYMQVTITDIDGDGNPDIVLGGSSGGVYTLGGYDTPLPMYQILMGRGNGTFVDSPVYIQGTYGAAGNANIGQQEIASADFNGDGKLDVLVYNNSSIGAGSALAMLPGDGTGALGAAVTSPLNIGATMLVAAKMNHDALTDAVLAGSVNAGPELAVLFNQGNGTFASEQDYPLAGSAVSLAVGDFNGDGIPDVAVGESGQGVFVFFGQSSGTLGSPVQVDASSNPIGLAAGSLTTDGRTDLVVADQTTGTLHVYLGNANGTFSTVTAPTTGATNLSVAALGDLNNDGKLDLIVAGFIPGTSGNPNISNVYTLLGNGDGTFQTANTLALGSNDIPVASMALADFNKSGNLGVVVGNSDDYTEVLLGNGDGTLIDSALALGQRPATVAAADLLGNGYPEILVGESDTQGQGNSLTVFLNQPAGWAATTAATSTVVTSSANPSTSGAAVTFTATVTSTTAGTITGTVTFFDGANSIGSGTVGAGGVATFMTSSLSTGPHSITAQYGGDTNYAASTSPVLTQTVNAAASATTATALTSSLNPSTTGASVTFTATVTSGTAGTITGTVTFFDGANSIGMGTLTAGVATLATSSLAAGAHSITAQYGGDAIYAASTSAALTQTVNAAAPATTSTALSASPNPATVGASVTFSATVTSTKAGSITGTVTFFDGANMLGTGAVGAGGLATFMTSSLAAGAHSITAQYGGDANYAASTSGAVTETINSGNPDFTVSANPTALTIAAGQSGNVTLTVTPVNGSTQPVAFACANLPAKSSCVFAPVLVTLDGTHSATSQMTLSTTGRNSSGVIVGSIRPEVLRRLVAILVFALAGIISLLWNRRGLRPWKLAMGFAVLAMVVGLVASCANSTPGTPLGTTQISVRAAGPNDLHTISVTITVQ